MKQKKVKNRQKIHKKLLCVITFTKNFKFIYTVWLTLQYEIYIVQTIYSQYVIAPENHHYGALQQKTHRNLFQFNPDIESEAATLAEVGDRKERKQYHRSRCLW